MPKLPRDVSHDRLVRFLVRRGWVIRGGKRHTFLRKGNDYVAIPRHGPIKTGTLAAILRAAGVTPEEWDDL